MELVQKQGMDECETKWEESRCSLKKDNNNSEEKKLRNRQTQRIRMDRRTKLELISTRKRKK